MYIYQIYIYIYIYIIDQNRLYICLVLTHFHYISITLTSFLLYYCSVEPSVTACKKKDESGKEDVDIGKSNEIVLTNEEVNHGQKLQNLALILIYGPCFHDIQFFFRFQNKSIEWFLQDQNTDLNGLAILLEN